MTCVVFDTGALSFFLAADERLRAVRDRIEAGTDEALLTGVTLAEFYYETCQTLGRDVASLRSTQIGERMRLVETDRDLSLSAGLEKCRNSRLSLADSYALALTKRVGGVLLTTDGELAKSREVSVRHFQA